MDVRDIRRRLGWSQARLADAIGTDPVTVSRWERGVSSPRPAARRRLAGIMLTAGPRGVARFPEKPELRIRELDRAVREQLSMKHRARRIS